MYLQNIMMYTLGRRKGRERRDGQRSGKSKLEGWARVEWRKVRAPARRETRAGRCRRARCAPSAPVGRRDTHEVSDRARAARSGGRVIHARHPGSVTRRPSRRTLLRFTACVRGKRRKIAPWHQAPDRWEAFASRLDGELDVARDLAAMLVTQRSPCAPAAGPQPGEPLSLEALSAARGEGGAEVRPGRSRGGDAARALLPTPTGAGPHSHTASRSHLLCGV